MRVVPAAAALAHSHLEQQRAALGPVAKGLLVALAKTAHQTLTPKLAVVVAVLLLLARLAQAPPAVTAAQVLQVQSLALR